MADRAPSSDYPTSDDRVATLPESPEKPPLDDNSNGSSEDVVQDGVKRIEAIAQTWTKTSLIVAYVSIMLMAFVTSLEGQVTVATSTFATSSFQGHSLLATVGVVQGVVNAVVKPPMAKVSDVFGRLEAYTISIALFTIGYIQMAASNNVATYASAQVFYSAGSTGQQILQQIFIADTSDMLNRALYSTLPDLPFLVTFWIGSLIAQDLMASSGTWRWNYGMWAIILPVCFLPLALSLYMNSRRAKKMGILFPTETLKGGPLKVAKNLWQELDIGGIILLSASFALILVPCTIYAKAAGGWSNPGIIAMVTVGAILLVIFPVWESNKHFAKNKSLPENVRSVLAGLAPYPLIPLHLLKSRTFSAGCVIAVFYFMAYYLSVQPYFNSYLLVVHNMSVQTAGYVTQTFTFSSTVASIVVSFFIKFSHRYKWFVVAGSCIYLLGMGLMMRYRSAGASVGTLVGTQICIGVGGGMLNVPAQLGVQASAGHQNVGTATAVFLTLISIGNAIGAAISGAVWTKLIPAKLAAYLPAGAKEDAMSIFASVDTAMEYAWGSPEREAINRSYQETMSTLLTIAVCVCVPIVVASLLMTDYKLDEMDQGVKGRVIGGEVSEDQKKTTSAWGGVGGSRMNPKNLFRKRETPAMA